jgi:hypothetical protein
MKVNTPNNSPRTPLGTYKSPSPALSIYGLDNTIQINPINPRTKLPEVTEEIRSAIDQCSPNFESCDPSYRDPEYPISKNTLTSGSQLSRGGSSGSNLGRNSRRRQKQGAYPKSSRNYKNNRMSSDQLKVEINTGSRGLLSKNVTRLVQEFSKSTSKYWDGEDGISGFVKQLECMRGFIRDIIMREMGYRDL